MKVILLKNVTEAELQINRLTIVHLPVDFLVSLL